MCVVTAQLPSAHIGPIFEDVGIELIPRTASKQIPAHVFPVHLDARRARTLDEEQTLVWMLARLPMDQQLATSALSGFWCACKGKRARGSPRMRLLSCVLREHGGEGTKEVRCIDCFGVAHMSVPGILAKTQRSEMS